MKKPVNISNPKQSLAKNSPKKIPEKFQPLPLVPAWILVPLWLVSLALPNLVYSGILFADTLHILKWTVTGVPVAIAVIVAAWRLLRYGRERIALKVDLCASLWALVLVYCAIQPLWVRIFSPTGYALEMVCFVCVWAFYVLSVASFPEWGLRPVILLANFNAAINVGFAELQIRNMNNLKFLDGTIFADLPNISNIILPTPGNYIGNTAQQNMFGLWVAVATLGAVWLFVYDAWRNDSQEHGRKIWLPALSVALAVVCVKFAVTQASTLLGVLAGAFVVLAFVLAFMNGNDRHTYFSVLILLLTAINFWGLMNSTSRSATLALSGGLILMLIISAWKFNRNYVIRFGAVMLVLGTVFWASMYSPRSGAIVGKTVDIIKNAENIGNRRGIWATSYAMLMEHPEGVGIGQYKWHYLEGQKYGFKLFPYDWYRWQYTHWAHNEFLQFFCEGGWIGGILFMAMYLSWFVPALIGLFRKKRGEMNINAVWAVCLASLITFCAIFTRPFHRIENMVWITLAFSISNREFFPCLKFKALYEPIQSHILRKLAAVACIAASICGIVYISSGIQGNMLLRKALSTNNADLQMYYLDQAQKHPIVYEESMRNVGYHYMQLGDQTDDIEMTARGFDILWEHFNHEPHSEDISKLLQFAQKYQQEEVLRAIAGYFKPGTYHLQRIPQKTSDGQVVNALLLVNGPGKDDD